MKPQLNGTVTGFYEFEFYANPPNYVVSIEGFDGASTNSLVLALQRHMESTSERNLYQTMLQCTTRKDSVS
eukprot:1371143-Amphidinium_carterae.1